MQLDYLALDALGSEQRGTIEAADHPGAVAQLAARGLTPVRIEAAKPVSRRRSGRRRDGGGRLALVLLVRELASLLSAGVTLEESLRTLIQSRAGQTLEQPLQALLGPVLAGERFSVSLEAQRDRGTLTVPPYVVALVRAGESTGDLAAALTRAADQMEFDEQIRAETSEALIYPAVLVAAGAAAVLFVFSFVVPRFSALLAGRDANLPWLSKAVLATGGFVSNHGVLLMSVLAAAAFAGVALVRLLGPARVRTIIADLPVFGPWLRQQELSRWTGMLALMLQSRVPILTSIELTAAAVGLPPMAERLRRSAGDIGRGLSMTQAFEAYELLPSSALSMVRVGERTGQLPTMMGHVAAYALEQNRRQRRRLVALIEPAAILLLGGIIGLIIVGVVLALTSLSDVKF